MSSEPSTAWLGVALTAAGVAFAIWACGHLGKYWSADVTIRSGHELIRTGSYAHVLHPIYSGTRSRANSARRLTNIAATRASFFRDFREPDTNRRAPRELRLLFTVAFAMYSRGNSPLAGRVHVMIWRAS